MTSQWIWIQSKVGFESCDADSKADLAGKNANTLHTCTNYIASSIWNNMGYAGIELYSVEYNREHGVALNIIPEYFTK